MAALSKLLKLRELATGRNSSIFAGLCIASWYIWRSRKSSNQAKNNEQELLREVAVAIHDDKKEEKAHVDALFLRRLSQLLKIVIPGWTSSEAWFLVMVAGTLISRTFCDVWMIQNGTSIESAIIGRDTALFKKYLFRFIYAMPMIAVINSFMKYGLNELKLRFRTRLTRHLYEKYLRGFTYYKMSNLDNRISNADQLLTQDVEKFCDSIADLYSNLSKPVLDVFIYAMKLANSIGAQGPGYMFLYLFFSGLILTRLRRPIGKLTIQEQKLEGDFRYVNSRLITNSEEIAFYQGNKREKQTLLATFNTLVKHLRSFITFRFSMGIVDSIVAKYVATVVGYLVVSRPFLNLADHRHLSTSHSERLEDYYKSGRMLVRMAQAIGRIVLAGREMTRLSGFTARITQLTKVLDDLNKGRYERTMVNNSTEKQLVPGSGQLIHEDYVIRFDHVPLVTPNGDVLVEDLNFEVKSGVNVLVCGPNGCGKSSLFRVLGELWPLFGGTLTKPDKGKLFYVPQRPYMTLGKLRDQVIYPDSQEDMTDKQTTDEHLAEILEKVQLSYLLEREGGWDAIQDWMDVLSGGEKQRIAMARIFYQKPQFAILDECTSAVSVDVEGFIYQHCKEIGITLFTVSHRKSLWKHHKYYLHMDGRGAYEFKEITDETTEFGS